MDLPGSNRGLAGSYKPVQHAAAQLPHRGHLPYAKDPAGRGVHCAGEKKGQGQVEAQGQGLGGAAGRQGPKTRGARALARRRAGAQTPARGNETDLSRTRLPCPAAVFARGEPAPVEVPAGPAQGNFHRRVSVAPEKRQAHRHGAGRNPPAVNEHRGAKREIPEVKERGLNSSNQPGCSPPGVRKREKPSRQTICPSVSRQRVLRLYAWIMPPCEGPLRAAGRSWTRLPGTRSRRAREAGAPPGPRRPPG